MTSLFLLAASAWMALTASATSVAPAALEPNPGDNPSPDYAVRQVTPENLSTVTELSNIEIVFDYAPNGFSPEISGDYAPDLWNPEVPYRKLEVKRNSKTVSTISIDNFYQDYIDQAYKLVMHLDTPQTADGIYEIVLPEAYIVDWSDNTSGRYTLRYQIGDGIGDEDPGDEPPVADGFRLDKITPAIGENIEELAYINASWLDSSDQPCVWRGPQSLLATVKGQDGNEYTVARVDVVSGNGGVFFTLNHSYSGFGTVYVRIPAGAVQSEDGSESNPEEIILNYPIFYTPRGTVPNEAYPGMYTHVDGPSGQSMEQIALLYAQSITTGSGPLPYLVKENGDFIEAESISVPSLDTTQGLITFAGADMLPAGKYSVVVPRNAFGGCSGLSFYYTFTPIPYQEMPDIPDDTKVEVTKCTVSGYDLMDPDNAIPALFIDAPLVMQTNLDAYCDVYFYKFLDVTDCKSEDEYDYAPAVHSSYVDKSGGSFNGIILSPGNLIRNLTSDRIYCMQIRAYSNYYNAAMRKDWGYGYSATFRGGSAPFEYADADVTVRPLPGMELAKGEPIVFTFSIPVDFDPTNSGVPQGQEGTLRPEAKSNADKTVWEFLLPEGAFADSSIEVQLGFKDAATGKRLRPSALNVPETQINEAAIYNYGTEYQSMIVVIYGSFDGKPEFSVVPQPGSTLQVLNEFTFTYGSGGEIMPSWMGEAVVRDEQGNAVAKLLADDLEENGGNVKVDYESSAADAKSIAVHLHLDTPITTPGNYSVEYPYGYFSTGREQDSDFTRPALHNYVVTGNGTVGIEAVSSIPARVAVYNLQGVLLLKDADASALQSLTPGIYILQSPEGSKKWVR